MSNVGSAARALLRAAGRSAAVLLVAGVVSLAAYVRLGPPSDARRYRQNEILRFSPTAGHGIGQLAGECMLVCLVAYAGRRWFEIRL